MLNRERKKKWKHNFPSVNGFDIIIDPQKLTEALELMWTDQIDPEDIDFYLVADFN